MDNYAWLDEKRNIRVYIDFAAADTVMDSDIVVTSTADSFEFMVTVLEREGEGVAELEKKHILRITGLSKPISGVTYKKKSDKFVLALKKVEELTWLDLKKKD